MNEPAVLAMFSLFCHAGSYLTRQIARWSKQYSASETHSIPTMDSLMQWLSTVSPRHDKTTVVHGDFRWARQLCVVSRYKTTVVYGDFRWARQLYVVSRYIQVHCGTRGLQVGKTALCSQ